MRILQQKRNYICTVYRGRDLQWPQARLAVAVSTGTIPLFTFTFSISLLLSPFSFTFSISASTFTFLFRLVLSVCQSLFVNLFLAVSVHLYNILSLLVSLCPIISIHFCLSLSVCLCPSVKFYLSAFLSLSSSLTVFIPIVSFYLSAFLSFFIFHYLCLCPSASLHIFLYFYIFLSLCLCLSVHFLCLSPLFPILPSVCLTVSVSLFTYSLRATLGYGVDILCSVEGRVV